MLGQMKPSRDLRRPSAKQNAEPVLSLHDLPLEICQLRRSPSPFRLEPIEVELRDNPLLETKL